MAGAEASANAAIAMAAHVGSAVALAHAHLVHSQFHCPTAQEVQEAVAAWEALRERADLLDWSSTNMMVMNCLEGIGQYDALVEYGRRVLADLSAAGAPALGGIPGAMTAHFLFRLGRWAEARAVIRDRRGQPTVPQVRGVDTGHSNTAHRPRG